jgi:hypothetical protein
MDVVVCVWGWAGPPPTMTLSAGKTYEFAARIKCAGTTPQMRVSLPRDPVRESCGEGMPDANGWKRVYKRFTTATDLQPKYFAVWLQGPGTAWCDDLSLKEVMLPPFATQATQTLVDASDTNVIVRVRQNGGSSPLKLHVTLPGGKSRECTIPPTGNEEISFDASTLSMGIHELSIEAIDGQSPKDVVKIQRVRGPFEK